MHAKFPNEMRTFSRELIVRVRDEIKCDFSMFILLRLRAHGVYECFHFRFHGETVVNAVNLRQKFQLI